jgi:hypothetical protein
VLPETERRIRWVCLFAGAWGVLTGYAIFILVTEQFTADVSQGAGWRLLAVDRRRHSGVHHRVAQGINPGQ